jgi:UDP-N-acetylglucosamine 4,6-dehydratase
VIPVFREQRKRGRVTMTDARMTRFWITLEQDAQFVVHCVEQMHGGEIFVPKIPSMKVVDIGAAIAPGCQVEYIGIRPDEKVHEVLVPEDEARNTVELDDMYVIQPIHGWWHAGNWKHGRALREGFQYASDSNTDWISGRDLLRLTGSHDSDVRELDSQAVGK